MGETSQITIVGFLSPALRLKRSSQNSTWKEHKYLSTDKFYKIVVRKFVRSCLEQGIYVLFRVLFWLRTLWTTLIEKVTRGYVVLACCQKKLDQNYPPPRWIYQTSNTVFTRGYAICTNPKTIPITRVSYITTPNTSQGTRGWSHVLPVQRGSLFPTRVLTIWLVVFNTLITMGETSQITIVGFLSPALRLKRSSQNSTWKEHKYLSTDKFYKIVVRKFVRSCLEQGIYVLFRVLFWLRTLWTKYCRLKNRNIVIIDSAEGADST